MVADGRCRLAPRSAGLVCGWQRLVMGGRGHVRGTPAFRRTRPPTDLHGAAEFIGFARGEDDNALGILGQAGQ